MIPEHEVQAMMERGAYLVDRVNLDRLARQVMSAEEAAAFVVLVEVHAADLARLLEERETLREALEFSPCTCLDDVCARCKALESASPEEVRQEPPIRVPYDGLGSHDGAGSRSPEEARDG